MVACEHCADRGWGLREGFVRRCEVCGRLEDDAAARGAAERDLAGFVLRERPGAFLPMESGAMRCPWCNHLPSNEDIPEDLELDHDPIAMVWNGRAWAPSPSNPGS